MTEVAAIGELTRIGGFGLAGARLYAADSPGSVLEAWRGLPDTVAVVILTPSAADALAAADPGARGSVRPAPLTVVMP